MSQLHSHPEAHNVARIGWLRAAVLGANDGLVSTASLILGVASASGKPADILIAGVAGLVAGAMSMAAGEYVSVSSQSDTEHADLARERKELQENVQFEREELAEIYVKRGVDIELARQVADQLMAKDALGAHARDELGISEVTTARPAAGGAYVRRDLRDRRGAATSDRAGFSPGCAGSDRRDRFPVLPRPAGRDWSQDRRCRRAEGDSSRHLLGRACDGLSQPELARFSGPSCRRALSTLRG